MPSWSLHLKWARKMGINENIVREINQMIDYPDKWFVSKYPEVVKEYSSGRKPIGIPLPCNEEPCILLFKLSKLISKFGHDIGGTPKRKWQMRLFAQCVYKHYGTEGVKAEVLHHLLDYIESYREKPRYSIDEILKKIEERFEELTLLDEEAKRIKEKQQLRAQELIRRNLAISEVAKETIEFVRDNIKEE